MQKILKIIIFVSLGILISLFIAFKVPLDEEKEGKESDSPTITKETQTFKEDKNEAERILDKLTLEQKIGQLFIIGFEGKVLTTEIKNLIKTSHPGGVLLLSRNIENKDQLKKLIADLQKISLEDNDLPLFIVVDQEGEPMCRIQWLREKTPQSEIKDSERAYEVGLNRGKELKNLGINLNLAPVLDITQPSDFLFERSFQKDAGKTGELAKAIISGQKVAGILTAIKHFPGYGGIAFNPERENLPILLKIPEISQFKLAIAAEPEIVMTSNVIYTEIDENLPFTLSPRGVQFLKDELKDDFLIISDDLSSPVLKNEFSLKNTVILTLQAGVDILIIAGFDEPKDPTAAFNFLLEAARKGEISEDKINQSVLKIIKLKQNLLY